MNELISVLTNDYKDARILNSFSRIRPYCTGVEIASDYAYSICPGRVVSIGKDSYNLYCVSVLVNDAQLIRYGHLFTCNVRLNQIVTYNDSIGQCYQSVLLEYCTTDSSSDMWPVRINDKTFYKRDPQVLLNGVEKLVVISETEGD